jgi:hypothetical protein
VLTVFKELVFFFFFFFEKDYDPDKDGKSEVAG